MKKMVLASIMGSMLLGGFICTSFYASSNEETTLVDTVGAEDSLFAIEEDSFEEEDFEDGNSLELLEIDNSEEAPLFEDENGSLIEDEVFWPDPSEKMDDEEEEISEKTGFQTAGEAIPINEENFPDDNFRTFLLEELEAGADGFFSPEEIEQITEISVIEKNIASLEGIKLFTSLERLSCENTQLSELDVSGCTALIELGCLSTPLTALNVRGCTKLKYLWVNETQLTSLDLSWLINLSDLQSLRNQLVSLDVSGCSSLDSISCQYNQLESLNLQGCTSLRSLSCEGNQLQTLDLSDCTKLENLSCESNKIDYLDLDSCPELEYLWCDNTQLTSLDLSDHSALCYVECAAEQLESLNASGCTALEQLRCSYCQLTDLNLENCNALQALYIQYNLLQNLDVSDCTNLQYLFCSNNQLTNLNVSSCSSIIEVSCSNNQLSALEIDNCSALTSLDCYKNNLSVLDISGCENLINLYNGEQYEEGETYIIYGNPQVYNGWCYGEYLRVDSFVEIISDTADGEIIEVKLDPNGGYIPYFSDPDLYKITVTVGKTYGAKGKIPDAVWSGHTFRGWYTKKTGGKIITGGMTVNPRYTTLYARWGVSRKTVEITGDHSLKAVFDPGYFFESSTKKNGQSGLLMLSAMAAYTTYYKSDKRLYTDLCSPLELLDACGFSNNKEMFSKNGKKNGHSTPDDNNHGYFYIGNQVLYDDNGDEHLLIGLIISGYSSGGYEWISNFNVGTDLYHEGFENAASEIKDKVYAYVKKQYKNTFKSVKYWITGHSRGAALTNIVALNLGTDATVYAYGFATPRYLWSKEKLNGHKNIINVISPDDFVPQVAPEAWKFQRYGQNLEFSLDYRDKMKNKFKDTFPQKYRGNDWLAVKTLVSSFVNIATDKEMYSNWGYTAGKTSLPVYTFGKKVPGLLYPYDWAMNGIGRIMSDDKAPGIAIVLGSYGYGSKYAVADSLLVAEGGVLPSISDAHIMETYLIWLLAGSELEKE